MVIFIFMHFTVSLKSQIDIGVIRSQLNGIVELVRLIVNMSLLAADFDTAKIILVISATPVTLF